MANTDGQVRADEVAAALGASRPPEQSAVAFGVLPGPAALAQTVKAVLTEAVTSWPDGVVWLVEVGSGYLQGWKESGTMLLEFGPDRPSTPDAWTRAKELGWVDPETVPTDTTEFESRAVWHSNPVQEIDLAAIGITQMLESLVGTANELLGASSESAIVVGMRLRGDEAEAAGADDGARTNRPESVSPAHDMVTSHVETLIERITDVDKARADSDGDYPVHVGDALYYVRVAGHEERPIVRVFTIVLADVEPSADLYVAINEINTVLGFCRCFWVKGQVLIETEHLGMTITTEDLIDLVGNVASASTHFGPQLKERFGGELAFDDSKGEAYEDPPVPGLYL